MYACGFSVPQMRQFCLFTYPPRSNELLLKRWFFLPKSGSSVSRSQAHLAKRYSSVYTTIFVRRKDKINYLSNRTWAKCYHSRNKHLLDSIIDSERQIFEKLFMASFFTLRVFARNLLSGNRRRNSFCILFWCLAWGSNPGFSYNKSTLYLLDHGDFISIINFEYWQPIGSSNSRRNLQPRYSSSFYQGEDMKVHL